MAIDEKVFKDAWALLCDRFNREPSKPVLAAYYETLSAKMTTAEFRIAAQRVFEEREFFPRPVDFLNAVRPDSRADALAQWELAQEYIAGNDVQLDAEAERVIGLLGGRRQLGMANTDTMPFVRKEFLQLYGEAAEIARRENQARLNSSEEGRKIASGVHLKALK